MIKPIEFVTEIYVDNDDAIVAEFAFTEKASVDTAIASFNAHYIIGGNPRCIGILPMFFRLKRVHHIII